MIGYHSLRNQLRDIVECLAILSGDMIGKSGATVNGQERELIAQLRLLVDALEKDKREPFFCYPALYEIVEEVYGL